MIDWSTVDTVFLDMDGTLLDLHFDNHFWLDHVPRRYAEARGLPAEQARADLLSRYKSREGTLEWYCIDHWSQELGLDMEGLRVEEKLQGRILGTPNHIESIMASMEGRPAELAQRQIETFEDIGNL